MGWYVGYVIWRREVKNKKEKLGNRKNYLCDIEIIKIYGKGSIREWNGVLEFKFLWNNGYYLRYFRWLYVLKVKER